MTVFYGARDEADPPLNTELLACGGSIVPTRRFDEHAIAMRDLHRRFWIALWLFIGSAVVGHFIARGLLNEPLLVALGIMP